MTTVSRRMFIALTVLATAMTSLSAIAQTPKGKLVLYTSQPERDASQTTAAFKQAYPGVEVEVFRSGTTELMGKLAAEFAARGTSSARSGPTVFATGQDLASEIELIEALAASPRLMADNANLR